MELLLHWMRKQEIDDKMIYKNAAIKQECFLRDQICMRLLHTHAFVVSTHMSKSIILPVYAVIDMIETCLNVWSDSCVANIVNKEVKDKLN